MLFIKRILGIDPRSKNQLANYSDLSKSTLLDPNNPITPTYLIKELSDTVTVINCDPNQIDNHNGLYKQGAAPNDPNTTDAEWNRANVLSDYNTEKTLILAIDVDEPNEANPQDKAYNPDYHPSSALLQNTLHQFLADTFGWALRADSYTPSPRTAKGRYYIASTHPASINEWVAFIQQKLYQRFKTPYIIRMAKEAIVTSHEVIDTSATKTQHRIHTYLKPLTLIQSSQLRNVNKLINNKNNQHKEIPTIDITTAASHAYILEKDIKKAKKLNITVKKLRHNQATSTMLSNTKIIHNRTKKTYNIGDTHLPEGNYKEADDTNNNYYIYNKHGVLIDYSQGMQRFITVRPAITHKVYHHTLDGYKDRTVSRSLLTFIEAPTNSGKTHEHRSADNKIFIVPTNALARDLSTKEGWHWFEAGTDFIHPKKDHTTIMTYDKFASSMGLEEYDIVVDEAPRLFKDTKDQYTGKRDRLIQALVRPANFKSVTLISADAGFSRLFNIYAPNPDKTEEHIYTKEHTPMITIHDKYPQLEGRQGVYINSVNKAQQAGEALGTDLVIYKGSPSTPSDIDKTDDSFVFTSLMREGYSLNSHIDHMVAHTKVSVMMPTGAVHAIQALSRARGTPQLHIIHGCKDIKKPVLSPEVLLSIAEALVGMDEKEKDDWDIQHEKHLTAYRDIRNAAHKNERTKAWSVNKAILIGIHLKLKAEAERADLQTFRESLHEAGYETRLKKHKTEAIKLVNRDGIFIWAFSFIEYVEMVNALPPSNAKDRELQKIEKLVKSKHYFATTSDTRLEILETQSSAIKYYNDPKVYEAMKKSGVLANQPIKIKSMIAFMNKMVGEDTWLLSKRINKTRIEDISAYLDANGVVNSWCTKDGLDFRPVMGGLRRRTIVGYRARDGTEVVATIQKGRKYKYPKGAYIKTENIDSFYERIIDKTIIHANMKDELNENE